MNQWNQSNPKPFEFSDALVDRALSGVSPEADATHEVEQLAAALDVSLLGDLEPMPAALRAAVEQRGAEWMSTHGASTTTADVAVVETDEALDAGVLRTLSPWLITAAALVFAFITWATGGSITSVEPSAQSMYASMADQTGTIRVSWDDLTDTGITGELIWDPSSKDGVFVLDGLEANEPTELQYQLWIFDSRLKSFTEFDAVDGGVFDITTKDGKSYVHIDAKLEVGTPYLFAVTSEPPGGVVKHVDEDDYRILLVAPVPETVDSVSVGGSCAPPPNQEIADRRGI